MTMTLGNGKKAVVATAGFGVAGAVSLYLSRTEIHSWYPVVFYAALVVNTYFSVRLFSAITPPRDKVQACIDSILAILYFALAFSFADIKAFLMANALLFDVAMLKYVFLLRTAGDEYRNIVERKILLDGIGVIAGTLALIGASLGRETIAMQLLTVSFILVNIQILILKPFYAFPRNRT